MSNSGRCRYNIFDHGEIHLNYSANSAIDITDNVLKVNDIIDELAFLLIMVYDSINLYLMSANTLVYSDITSCSIHPLENPYKCSSRCILE